MNYATFKKLGDEFLQELFLELKARKVDSLNGWVDHLCYRTETNAEYEELKVTFTGWSDLLIESEVNGRLISTYRLHEPFKIQNETIYVVELPAPKKGKALKKGFEHIEVVTKESFENLQNQFSDFEMDLNGLKKSINPELEIKTAKGAVKFHHQSLESVIELEKRV